MLFKKGDTTHSIADGGLVKLDDSSNLIPPANDSTDNGRILGVARLSVALTDTSSWAGAPMVPVEVPIERMVEWEIDADSDAGAAASDVGRYCGIDTTGGNSVAAGDSAGTRVDISDTAIRTVGITGLISASKVRGVLNDNKLFSGLSDSA